MKRINSNAAGTALERHVLRWINERATDYNGSGVEGVLTDLFYGGCASGMVGHLIYYADTVKFYKKYRSDIAAIIKDLQESIGGDVLSGLKQWDKDDPLANETNNQNVLAWLGFEEAARIIADRAGVRS